MGWAQTQSFDQVWKKISEKSYLVESATQQEQADEIALSRANDHWLPRAYASAKWFGTNDSAQVLFSNLGQRSVEAADFVPAQLNDPGFDAVIAYGLLEGMVPHFSDPAQIETAKKLVYVVSSRARKNLHLISERGRSRGWSGDYQPTDVIVGCAFQSHISQVRR